MIRVTLLLTLLLGGCATPNFSTQGATFCEVAQPFRWSVKDTRPTQEQAVSHNAVGKELCGWTKSQ